VLQLGRARAVGYAVAIDVVDVRTVKVVTTTSVGVNVPLTIGIPPLVVYTYPVLSVQVVVPVKLKTLTSGYM
jgi:hypothetical protein